VEIVENLTQLQNVRSTWPHPIGFVPTMGALHTGHRSLIERARTECQTVAVSIYVNPTQFGPKEDFSRYPRDLPRDLALCAEAGVDVVLVPATEEIYPAGHQTVVEVHSLEDRWEGATRPGHFRGVATVVTVLFGLVRPDRAYFGEKDFQQLQIIRRLSRDLRLGLEIIPCPTVREPDGLALSSRNIYLNAEERQTATVLFRALQTAQQALDGGQRTAAALTRTIIETVKAVPGVDLDYVAVVDPETLDPLEQVETKARALIAARVGGVHLIDNYALVPPPL
jgi:pantoate--beta-alanine ligase